MAKIALTSLFLAPQMLLAGSHFSLSTKCPAGFSLNQKTKTCQLEKMPYTLSKDPHFTHWRELPFVRLDYSPQLIDLGRYLFFDPILSKDHTLSCGHCHHPRFGMSDGRALSHGKGGAGLGPQRNRGIALLRSAPTLWNTAFLGSYFWDARARSLEAQVIGPLFNENEMDNTQENIEKDLNAIVTYRRLFSAAFPAKERKSISFFEVVTALVAFESSLLSLDSPYDRYISGDKRAMNDLQIKGFGVFRSFVTRCSECHTPPLFTNRQVATIGAPEFSGAAFDRGAGVNYNSEEYDGGFKIPTLRNIAKTAPYMHSGGFSNLEDVVDFYNRGAGLALKIRPRNRIHWHIRPMGLAEDEERALVAFLHGLTDESRSPEIPKKLPSLLEPPH